MNTRSRLVLGFVLVMTAASSPPVRIGPSAAEDASDKRQRIDLVGAERDSLLTEMRAMLHSLNRIMHGLAANDLAMVEEAARAAGTRAALDPQLEKKLPPHFQQLGRTVHQRFDQLADVVKASGTSGDVVKRLAALTGYCVSCHDVYRVDEKR